MRALPSPRRIAVIGGGASGALVALHMMRRVEHRTDVEIFEPRQLLARGLAYSTTDALHRLNVPAGQMSADPDEPDDFIRWSGADPSEFAARRDFGLYVEDRLSAAIASAPGTLTHRRAMVRTVGRDPDGPERWRLTVADTDRPENSDFDAVVLAIGNPPTSVPSPVAPLVGTSALIAEPWAPDALSVIGAGEAVLVVGTGLSFVDITLTLMSIPNVHVTAVSRHGLVPAEHAPLGPLPVAPDLDTPLGLTRWVRSHGDRWREAMAALRPTTPRMWTTIGEAGRRQFLRHAHRYWEVHRHRVAPAVRRSLDRHLQSGRVTVRADRIISAEIDEHGRVWVTSNRGSAAYDRVVLCTGASDSAFLRLDPVAGLIAGGLARPAPHDLGIDVDATSGAVLGADGRVVAGLYAVGPIRRGSEWETTAIPEIRVQAQRVAARLTG